MKTLTLAVALGGLVALAASPAMAAAPSDTGSGVNTSLYHSYDGLVCADCHTMHFSEGDTTPAGADAGGPWQKMLKKKTTADICLSCHTEGTNTQATAFGGALAGSGAPTWTAPIVKTLGGTMPAGISMPAGDFWYSDDDSAPRHNPSWTNGNQTAQMSTDPVLAATFPPTPPGLSGSYNEQDWDCHTCHGMHNRFSGSYTAWRQLKRKINGNVVSGDVSGLGVETTTGNKGATAAGFEPLESNSRGDIQGTSYVNLRQDGDPLDGADLWAPYSATNKNVYRGGFSSFCSNCHGNFHGGTETSTTSAGIDPTSSTGNTAQSGPHWFRHPTNVNLDGKSYNVSKYTVTVTNTQGTNPNPVGYDWKYPLRRVNGTWTVTRVSTAGEVASTDKVMCLTCHFAHAGPNANALRWNEAGQAAFIANGVVDSYGEASNGDNPAFGCNKCHQKGGAKAYVKTF